MISLQWLVATGMAWTLTIMGAYLATLAKHAWVTLQTPYAVAFASQAVIALVGTVLVLRAAQTRTLFEHDKTVSVLWYLIIMISSFLFLMTIRMFFGPFEV